MPNVIRLTDIPAVINAVVRGIQEGRRLAAADCGVQTVIMEDDQVQFQMQVVVDGGLNAISRTQSSETQGTQKAVTTQDPVITTEVEGQKVSQTRVSDDGQTINESASTNENSSDAQSTSYGKQSRTDISYES